MAKNVSKMATYLNNAVPAFIKKSSEFDKERSTIFQQSAAFAIFHGDCRYLIQLDAGISQTDRTALNSFMATINNKGLRALFGDNPEVRNNILSAIEGMDNKAAMRVTVFGRKEKIINIGSNPAAKLFKAAVKEVFKTEEDAAEAMNVIKTISDSDVKTREDNAFNEGEYLARVIATVIKKVGAKDQAEAARLANGINNLIKDADEKLRKGEIENMLRKAQKSANSDEASVEIPAASNGNEEMPKEDAGEAVQVAA